MSGEVLLQSTSVDVTFSAYLSSDHVTPATGKTIAITISKNKGAFGNPSAGATNATEIASGVYYVNLSTTDTGTLGPLVLLGTAATIDNVVVHYRVRQATNMDMTALPAVATGNAGAVLVDGTGTAAISNSSGKVLLQATQSGVTIPTVTTVTNGVTVTTNNDKTGYSLTQSFPTNFASLGISAAGIVNADIKKVNAVTVNGAGTSGSPWGP